MCVRSDSEPPACDADLKRSIVDDMLIPKMRLLERAAYHRATNRTIYGLNFLPCFGITSLFSHIDHRL